MTPLPMECPAAESPSRAIPRRVENRITWRWGPCDTGFESRLQEIGQSGHRHFRHLRRNFRNGPCRVRVRWRHIIRLPSAKALAARPGRECGERGADVGSGWPDGWPIARPFPWRRVESGRMPCGTLRRHPGGESGLTAGARFQTARVPDRAEWTRRHFPNRRGINPRISVVKFAQLKFSCQILTTEFLP